MDDLGRKNLRAWLQKSLANHPENDNGDGLVAYVEAIVGDAEGTVSLCFAFVVSSVILQSYFRAEHLYKLRTGTKPVVRP